MKKQTLLIIAILLFSISVFKAQTPGIIDGGVLNLNGKAVNLPAPKYPAAAKMVGACGAVKVKVLVDEEGNISSTEAVSGHPLLRSAAEKAARQARFKPTMLSGQPVKVSGILAYVFDCDDKKKSENSVKKDDGDAPETEKKSDSEKGVVFLARRIENKEPDNTSASGTVTGNVSGQGSSPTTISGGVVNGKATSLPAPKYPAAAQAVGASGAVNVQVLIDEQGNVISANAVSGHPLLRSAAAGAARNAKFRPTQLEGKPVKVSGVITYVFNLPKTGQNDEGGSPTAGDIPANSPDSSISEDREKLNYLALSAIIRVLMRINADENLEYVATQFFNDFINGLVPEELPEDLEFIKELATAPKERRAELLSAFNSVLRESASNTRLWYISFGEDLGDLIADSLKRTVVGGTGSAQIKSGLSKIKNSLISAPPDFPKNLREPLTGLIEFSEQNNLADVDILSEFDDKIMEIGDLIFEENE